MNKRAKKLKIFASNFADR